ncbi:MAG: hypothetical protein GC152_02070 [Alphaproteobacteria bacterium]|nr:hypothetical protein [Alphaproteobacteria bacterium]
MADLTFFHVSIGALAVAAGATALVARKGASIHVAAGRMFVATMSIASILGAALGLIASDRFLITAFAGVLAAYLVVTGWLAARGPSQKASGAGVALAISNLLNLGALATIGVVAVRGDGAFRGFPAEDYFFLGGMAAAAALGDAAWLARRAAPERQRIARHLWRMCLGFFIAAGSAFTGPGQAAFPAWLQQSGALALPELFIFLALIFFLIRTRFRGPPALR